MQCNVQLLILHSVLDWIDDLCCQQLALLSYVFDLLQFNVISCFKTSENTIYLISIFGHQEYLRNIYITFCSLHVPTRWIYIIYCFRSSLNPPYTRTLSRFILLFYGISKRRFLLATDKNLNYAYISVIYILQLTNYTCIFFWLS